MMAGSMLSIQLEDAQFKAAFSRLRNVVDGRGMRLALSDIGEAMKTSTEDRAEREEAPDGTAWIDLTPKYKARKEKQRPGVKKLKFDGHMLGDMLSWQLDGDHAVLIGTNAIYGARQQEDRPFLGISADDRTEIIDILGDHILRAAENRTP